VRIFAHRAPKDVVILEAPILWMCRIASRGSAPVPFIASVVGEEHDPHWVSEDNPEVIWLHYTLLCFKDAYLGHWIARSWKLARAPDRPCSAPGCAEHYVQSVGFQPTPEETWAELEARLRGRKAKESSFDCRQREKFLSFPKPSERLWTPHSHSLCIPKVNRPVPTHTL
jgi:hypothetical protein